MSKTIEELEETSRKLAEESLRSLQRMMAILLYIGHQDAIKLKNYLRNKNV